MTAIAAKLKPRNRSYSIASTDDTAEATNLKRPMVGAKYCKLGVGNMVVQPKSQGLVSVNMGLQEERIRDQQTFWMILFAELAVLSTDDNHPSNMSRGTPRARVPSWNLILRKQEIRLTTQLQIETDNCITLSAQNRTCQY